MLVVWFFLVSVCVITETCSNYSYILSDAVLIFLLFQLAPQYLMQSTWLDETINAVVAGLNTAMYVRDLTPHRRARRRRRRGS